MKNKILFIILFAGIIAGSASARVSTFKYLPKMERYGLYTAFDSATGYDQVYYRALLTSKTIQLTTSNTEKTSPAWGPKNIAFDFYNEALATTTACSGNLFYYLEEIAADQNQLSMGCLDTGSSAVFEGYALSGFDGLTHVDEYYVAEGTDLNYTYDGTEHDAYPLVVYNEDAENLLLHDHENYFGSFDEGSVAYYDGTLSGDAAAGWVSTLDDAISWNGVIKCPKCLDHADNPGDSTPEEDEEENETDEVNSDDTTVIQDTDVTQESDQTTTVESDTVSSSSATSSASQDSQNSSDSDIVINVDVTVVNDNSSESSAASSSDFSGSVSSTSESSSTSEEQPESEETTEPSADISTDVASDPLAGASYSMQGGGGCSLSGYPVHNAAAPILFSTPLLLIILLRQGIKNARRV